MAGLGADEKISNRILNSLPPATLARLRPHLERENLPAARVLSRVGETIHKLYFMERGIASLIQTMHDGRTVEVGAMASKA